MTDDPTSLGWEYEPPNTPDAFDDDLNRVQEEIAKANTTWEPEPGTQLAPTEITVLVDPHIIEELMLVHYGIQGVPNVSAQEVHELIQAHASEKVNESPSGNREPIRRRLLQVQATWRELDPTSHNASYD